MTKICVLFASARSGTTALGQAAAEAYAATWGGEVFHHGTTAPHLDLAVITDPVSRRNFFNYRHELLRRRPEMSYPSRDNQAAIFGGYLEYLGSLGDARLLIDVKYAAVHHLNEYWTDPSGTPLLLTLMQEFELPIVHLVRRNLFALYCSLRLAEETGVWFTDGPRAPAGLSLQIRPDKCLGFLDALAQLQSQYGSKLDHCNVRRLAYEDLFAEDRFSAEVQRVFSDIYEMAPDNPMTTASRKVTPPLHNIVTNPDEVLSALRGTPYEAMAEAVLG